MRLKIIKEPRGPVSRAVGEVIKYNPWLHSWQGMSEPERVATGLFVHCYGHGEFEVLRLGDNVVLTD